MNNIYATVEGQPPAFNQGHNDLVIPFMIFYVFCRQEWELAIYKGSNCFQTLEEERLAGLKNLVTVYHKHNKETAPKLVAVSIIER